MKNKFIYLVCVMLMQTAGLSLFAQRPAFNQYNAEGKKEGLWIENLEKGQDALNKLSDPKADSKRIKTYKDGKLTDLSFSLWYGNVSDIAMYQDDQPTGFIAHFDHGALSSIILDCGRNTSYSVSGKNGECHYPDFKGYGVNFDSEGNIESEGILLWNKGERVQIEAVYYGEWKFYDKDRKVTTKVF